MNRTIHLFAIKHQHIVDIHRYISRSRRVGRDNDGSVEPVIHKSPVGNQIAIRRLEAARLNGAGELGLLWRIAIPLALPGLGTIAILNILFTWNDIIWPLVSIFDREALPIAAGLLSFRSDFRTEYGPLFAGYTLASIPLIVVFAFTIRRFIRGLEGGLSL